LALSCDIRLASTKAVFGQPEVGLGITPGFGGSQRLARLIGPGLAKEMLFSGCQVRSERALAIGLVNAVYQPEQLLEQALELANRIAAQAPAAVRATKEALSLGLGADLDSAIAIEAGWFASCFETADQRAGMTAFLERRQPEPFQDR
jgi:enoyl-CoA hydratase